MVRSRFLTPDHIVGAMKRSDFYASSDVELESIESSGKKLTVKIAGAKGEEFTTQFIGTRKGYDQTNSPRNDDK